jgi:4-amino-4-deoxy-L-arabinose transferase-like glycosyltransferase
MLEGRGCVTEPAATGIDRGGHRRWAWDVVLLVAMAGWLVGIRAAHSSLVDPDESRSALVCRLMAERGDWLAPHLPVEFRCDYPGYPVEGDQVAYWDKPPLFFWLGAAAMQILGPTALAVRLPSALSHLATVLLVYAVGRRLWGRWPGLLAGAIVAVVPLTLVMAHVARMEALLLALVTLAMWAALRLLTDRPRSWTWTVILYGAVGLGLLTKGPVAAAIPAAAVGLTIVLTGRWRDVARIRPIAGSLIALVIAAPWFLYMAHRYPAGVGGSGGYLHDFFLLQNLARATTDAFGHHQVPGMLLGLLLLGLMPWTVFLPGALGRLAPFGWRARREAPAVVLLLVWAALVVGVFSASRTQLPHYVAPAVPPLALLIGAYVAERTRPGDRDRLFAVGLWITTGAAAAGLVALVIALKCLGRWHVYYTPVVVLIAAVTVAGAVAIARGRRDFAVHLISVGMVVVMTFVLAADPFDIYARNTTRLEWRLIRKQRRPGDRVVAYPHTPYSLAWYAWPERVAWPAVEPGASGVDASLPRLVAWLNEPQRTFCVIQGKGAVAAVQQNARWPVRIAMKRPAHTVLVTEPGADAALAPQGEPHGR